MVIANPPVIPESFLRRAAARLPRYTSYPTAPFFSPAVATADYRAWLAALDPKLPVSLYLHLPYCAALCWYCGCHTKVAHHAAPVERYVAALKREIALLARYLPGRLTVTHLHWGGGTPTLAGEAAIGTVMDELGAYFDFAQDAEIAIEIDPRTLTPAMADALGAFGFTRASFGVQSFDPAVQKAVNRIQSYATTEAAAGLLRRAGIEDLNLDLLYGLPLETVESCRATVERSLALGAQRYAVFGYAHVPAVKPHQRKLDARDLPDAEARWRQEAAIAASLVAAGYRRIGIDHFARPDDALAVALDRGTLRRNFQGYTTDRAEVLLGLGASAIGKLPQGYVQNLAQVAHYEDKVVGADDLPIARGLALGAEDRLRAAVIERLMCDLAVDLDAVAAAHGAAPGVFAAEHRALQSLGQEGLVRLDGHRVIVPEAARVLVRQVAAVFDAYLGKSGTHAPAV